MASGNLAEFEAIIKAALGQSDELRKQAEAALDQRKSDPNTYVLSLGQLFQGSSNPSVRILAGVLLRQQLDVRGQTWDNASDSTRAQVQQILLQLLGQADEVRIIRRTVAEAIGSLAILVLPSGGWPDFLPSLFQMSASPVAGHRMSVALILEKLVQFIPETVQSHFDQIKKILYASLSDSNSEVCAYAVAAMVSLLIALSSPQRKQMAECIPLVFKAIVTNVGNGDEDRARDVLEALIQLVSCDAPFLKPFLADIVSTTAGLSSNTELEDSTRKMSVEFLLSLAEHGQGMIRKASYFVQTCVPVARAFLLEVDQDSDWHAVADEMQLDQDNFVMGLQATDRLAGALGGKVFLPVALPLIQTDLQSANWVERHAALCMLSEMADGCAKFMRPKQDEVLQNYILPALADPHHRVRWAAVNCMAQLCNDYAPTFQSELHEQIIPALIAAMKDPVVRVSSHAALCLVDFCAGIESEDDTAWFEQYTDAALGELLQMLQAQKSIKSMESVLTAVASIAHICRGAFAKYYDFFMPPVKEILRAAQGNKDTRLLRGKAMECVGLIGNAVGHERFSTDALEVMHILMETQQGGLSNDDPQYQYMVQALARICECVGEAFVPFLPHVIPPLLVSASAEGGRMVPDVGVDDEPEEGIERVVVAVRGQGNVRLEYNTAVLEEKATACHMLFQYASRLKGGFFPYVAEVLRVVTPLVRYRYNESVRVASVSALPALLTCAHDYVKRTAGTPQAPPNGMGLVREYFEEIFVPMIECMRLEPDIDQLCNIVRSFTECVELLVDPLSADQIGVICVVVQELMQASKERRQEREKKVANEDADEETMDQVQAETEDESEFLGLIIDFVNRMVKNAGQTFAASFHQHLAPSVTQFLTSPQASQPEQVTAICIFDDIIEHGGQQAVSEYAPPFLPFLLQNMASPDVEIRQACLYGIGVLGQVLSPDVFLPHRDKILGALAQIVEAADSRAEENYPSTCNAASAFRKICAGPNGAGLDLDSLWPRWLSWLPLDGDEDEARLTHVRLMDMVQAQDANVVGGAKLRNLPQLVRIFSDVVFSMTVSDRELNGRIASFWKALNAQLPAEAIQQLVAPLSAKQQEKLADCLKFADISSA